MNGVLLEDRAVLLVSGEEAGEFLDRLLTNSVIDLKPGESRLAALLTPQGKVICDILLARQNELYCLVVRQSLAGDLLKRLTMYRLRSKVAISLVSVAAPMPAALVLPPPAGPDRKGLRIETDGSVFSFSDTLEGFHAARIAAGIPEGGVDFTYGDAFPHEINLDRLHGVDFRKGCYVGQEIVSRTEHRGTARTRMMRISYTSGYGPEPGASVLAGEKVIGSAGLSIAGEGLALIRLDKLADALVAGLAITAGGIPAIISAPPYAPDFMPVPAA